MERGLGGPLDAVDTPPARPPGAGEERQGQRVLDVVQRLLRRFPQSLRLPVVRPTVSKGKVGREQGERGGDNRGGERYRGRIEDKSQRSHAAGELFSDSTLCLFHRSTFPPHVNVSVLTTLAVKWQAMDSP